jgi:hypothetical protein
MECRLYSPDLEPSNFVLCGPMKENLSGHRFDSVDDFFAVVEILPVSFSEGVLQTGFQEWIWQL